MSKITDESRKMRHTLASLCERYLTMLADKDALDYRLGSGDSYEDGGMPQGGAERAYEDESKSASADVRRLIVEMIDVGGRIRALEAF